MKKIFSLLLLLAFGTTLFAGIKREVDMQTFIKELKQIQKAINESKPQSKNWEEELQRISQEERYKRFLARNKDIDIAKVELLNTISLLKNYLYLIRQANKRYSIINGKNYFEINKVGYLEVSKNDILKAYREVFKNRFKIVKIEKMISLLNSINKFKKDIFLNNKSMNILNQVKSYAERISTMPMSFNYGDFSSPSSVGNLTDYCSIKKKCFGFKVKSVNAKQIIVGF